MTQRHLCGNPTKMHFLEFHVLLLIDFQRNKKCCVIFFNSRNFLHSKTIIMSNFYLYNFQYQHNFGLELNEEFSSFFGRLSYKILFWLSYFMKYTLHIIVLLCKLKYKYFRKHLKVFS